MATPARADSGPVPPGMHWAMVLLLSIVTFGIFSLYWALKQANFVKRLDPTNPADKLYWVMIVVLVAYTATTATAVYNGITTGSTEALATVSVSSTLADAAMAVLTLVAIFKMRASLLDYYNSVEPINLKLSGGLTFFFNILYFQYHFHRIARWKRTGVLM